jgi:rod shape-determining protein MreC
MLIWAVLVSVVLAIAANTLNTDIPGLVVKTVIQPLRSGAQALTNQAQQMYSYMFRYESLLAENQALKEQISRMEDNARDADALAREVARLRAALELKERNPDYKMVDAYISGWDPTDWASSFTMDKGTLAGVEKGQCVITANGEVVGLVIEVGPNFAVVRTVLDSSLEISATIATSGYSGMVQGGYATGNDGMLRMNYLPSDSVIRNNDQVVTAGSTVYPRDLILGYVVDAGFDETGVAKFSILEPAADFGALEQVFVLTQYDTE